MPKTGFEECGTQDQLGLIYKSEGDKKGDSDV